MRGVGLRGGPFRWSSGFYPSWPITGFTAVSDNNMNKPAMATTLAPMPRSILFIHTFFVLFLAYTISFISSFGKYSF